MITSFVATSILNIITMHVGISNGQNAITFTVSYENGPSPIYSCLHDFTANYTAISVVAIFLNNPRNWAPCYCVFYERDNRPLNHLQVVVRNEATPQWVIHKTLLHGMWNSTSVGLPYFRIDNKGSQSALYTPGDRGTDTYTYSNTDFIFKVSNGQQLNMNLWCSPHGFPGSSTESPDTTTTTPVTTTSTTAPPPPSSSISHPLSPSPPTFSPTPAHNNTSSMTGSHNTTQNSMYIIIGAVIAGVVVLILISVVIIIILVPIRKQRSKRGNQVRTSGNSDTTESVMFNNNHVSDSEGIAPHHTLTEKNKTRVENSIGNEAEQIQYADINIGLLAPKQPAPSTDDKTITYADLPFHTRPVSDNISPPEGKSAIANPQPDQQTPVQELYATVDKVNNNRLVPAQGKQKPKVMKSKPIAGEKSEQSQSTDWGPVTYENFADNRKPLAQVSPVVREGDNGSCLQVEYANVL